MKIRKHAPSLHLHSHHNYVTVSARTSLIHTIQTAQMQLCTHEVNTRMCK